MPELPEVETIVRDLIAAGLTGRRIQAASVFWDKSIAVPGVDVFISRMAGATITRIYRRGKYIGLELDNKDTLLIHLRMSGRIVLENAGTPRGKHQHVIMACAGGDEVRFHDPRKFGRFYLVKDTGDLLGRLGPEPLAADFKWQHFKKILKPRKRMIKPLLLDQHMIAGLGNIYADESLWEAGIHPATPSNLLKDNQIKKLHHAIRKVLRRGLKNRGTALGNGLSNFNPVGAERGKNQTQLNVFRRQGQPCPRCRETVVRVVLGQRSTHICRTCQPESFNNASASET